MKYFLIILLSTQIICNIQAQELRRKGSLGITFETLNNTGILVTKVLSNTTASTLGVEAGDVIKVINGKPVLEQESFLRRISLWREGDNLTMAVERNGRPVELHGTVMPKPLEQPSVGNIEYGAVKFRDGYLRSILNKPMDIEKPPCIYMFLGYGCRSIDYYHRKTVIRIIVESLVGRGFAVYRVERPGMGDSNNSQHCREIGFHDEIEAFNRGLVTLKNQQKIDTSNIFLFGVSQGGVVAITVAANNPVKGIINYGSLFFTSYHERILRAPEFRAIHTKTSKAIIEADIQARQPILYEFFINGKHPKELAKNKEWSKIMRTGWPYWNGEYILGRHPSYLRQINDINLEVLLKEAKCPVLAIHAEYDYNIGNSRWAERTAATVNSILPDKGKFVILKGTEHGFAKVPSIEKYLSLLENGQYTDKYREANFNYDLIEVISEWVLENTI